MILTGPIGWIVLGTAAGVGTGVTVSSVQQYCDKEQLDFDYKRTITDGIIGGAIGAVRGEAGAREACHNTVNRAKSKDLY